MMRAIATLVLAGAACSLFSACSAKSNASDAETPAAAEPAVAFNADSALSYVERQTLFGPRVPNTEAHRLCGEWLAAELRRHGAEVSLQQADLTAFDGTVLKATNIIGQYNPEADDRLLLLAHWDSRPWADNDPDPAKHKEPVVGANDGASGVGVLLETARALAARAPERGVDILFVDAEDWGDHSNDDSWAMGTRHFVEHPFRPGYAPSEAILLDMVGGQDARFPREFFSQRGAPDLLNRFWSVASASGFGDRFMQTDGGAVTDDHVQLLQAGIPAIDIIELRRDTESGFNPTWHTSTDTFENIDKQTLGIVGQALLNYIYGFKE